MNPPPGLYPESVALLTERHTPTAPFFMSATSYGRIIFMYPTCPSSVLAAKRVKTQKEHHARIFLENEAENSAIYCVFLNESL